MARIVGEASLRDARRSPQYRGISGALILSIYIGAGYFRQNFGRITGSAVSDC
jgi:hypothetical protein